MHESFAVGDVIDHPKFGNGVVQELLPPDKMQILFRDGAACCAARAEKSLCGGFGRGVKKERRRGTGKLSPEDRRK